MSKKVLSGYQSRFLEQEGVAGTLEIVGTIWDKFHVFRLTKFSDKSVSYVTFFNTNPGNKPSTTKQAVLDKASLSATQGDLVKVFFLNEDCKYHTYTDLTLPDGSSADVRVVGAITVLHRRQDSK